MVFLIAVICFIGAYGISNGVYGILIVIIFGLVGYLMRQFKYDPAPLILAFVLGPIMEDSLRQSLMLFRGNVFGVFQRPIALLFLIITFLVLFSSPMVKFFKGVFLKVVQRQG